MQATTTFTRGKMITIHNAATGEITVRELDAQEKIQFEKDQITGLAQEQAAAQAAAKRAVAEAKLAALGLTADDLKALGL